jgi:hypothetical protein
MFCADNLNWTIPEGQASDNSTSGGDRKLTLVFFAVKLLIIEGNGIDNAHNEGIKGPFFITRDLASCAAATHQYPFIDPCPNAVCGNFIFGKGLTLFIYELYEQELYTHETGVFLSTYNRSANPSNLHEGLRATHWTNTRDAFAELLDIFGVADGEYVLQVFVGTRNDVGR